MSVLLRLVVELPGELLSTSANSESKSERE